MYMHEQVYLCVCNNNIYVYNKNEFYEQKPQIKLKKF